jgi:putative transposase
MVLEHLRSERFADKAPAQVHATLLEEGVFLCSERTMYRILEENREVRERRAQLVHPRSAVPVLVATKPNQVWSWDVTQLRGPIKGEHYFLYVVLDISIRYVVEWMLAHRESATLAERLIRSACERHGIWPGQLTAHSDRGSIQVARMVHDLYEDLGIIRSLSRPRVLSGCRMTIPIRNRNSRRPSTGPTTRNDSAASATRARGAMGFSRSTALSTGTPDSPI